MSPNFEMLSENARNTPNLTINDFALGKEEGTLEFVFEGDNSGAIRQNANGLLEIKVTILECFVEENEIDKVNFIKVDIEGAECVCCWGLPKLSENSIPN